MHVVVFSSDEVILSIVQDRPFDKKTSDEVADLLVEFKKSSIYFLNINATLSP